MPNPWFWLFFVLIPAIVLAVKPEAPVWLRAGRILLAIAAGYALANLALEWKHDQDWKAHVACEARLPAGTGMVYQHCGHLINIADGAAIVFYLLFGWVPAAAYAGLWELAWRWRYRRRIRALSRGGNWVGTIAIGVFALCLAYPLVMMALFLSGVAGP